VFDIIRAGKIESKAKVKYVNKLYLISKVSPSSTGILSILQHSLSGFPIRICFSLREDGESALSNLSSLSSANGGGGVSEEDDNMLRELL
jgi:hypothetical protein